MTENPILIKKYANAKTAAQTDVSFIPDFNDENQFIREYRQKSWDRFKSMPLPSGKEDEWRRTNLKAIEFPIFKLIDPAKYGEINFPESYTSKENEDQPGGLIRISPVDSVVKVDEIILKQGVVFDSLKNLVRTNPGLVEKMVSAIKTDEKEKFSSLAGALELNGILLYVPKKVQVSLPLQSFYWAPGEGMANAFHVLVHLEEGASVTYVHESASPKESVNNSLHAGLMNFYVGTGAHLSFVELQAWGENVINFTQENVFIDRDGSIDWIFGALGSKLTKNFSNLNLVGQGSSGKMSGFYFTGNTQHLDHDTQQNHLAPNTTSDFLFKGALLDKSRSVWQGMIYVSPNATKTNGYQANRNLVLSRQARADSIPGLEILTDDVRCSHGATVGKIDEDQVFYLESRGIPRDSAEKLLVEGFFDPIMQRIPLEGVRQRVKTAIEEKMEHIW